MIANLFFETKNGVLISHKIVRYPFDPLTCSTRSVYIDVPVREVLWEQLPLAKETVSNVCIITRYAGGGLYGRYLTVIPNGKGFKGYPPYYPEELRTEKEKYVLYKYAKYFRV